MNNISKYIALFKIMHSVGNVNYAVSVVGKFILNSNYEKSLPLNIDSLDLICACSDEDDYLEKSKLCIIQ